MIQRCGWIKSWQVHCTGEAL